ncbi:hypothetical protein VTI74DRAFT_5879 [Chaetomium olivicolor]
MGFTDRLTAVALLASVLSVPAAAVDVDVSVSALTSEVESDWTSVFYGKKPLILGNEGTAATGGWHAWALDSTTPLTQAHAETPGRRTKLVTTIHGRDDDKKLTGLAVSIGQPDSILRAWELPDFEEVKSARTKALGDWSALCSWKSPSGGDYIYLFGKRQAKVFFVRKEKHNDDYDDAEFVEIQTFPLPVEASGCASSPSLSKMFVSADDDKDVYVFDLAESTAAPTINKIGEAEGDVTGVATYVSGTAGVDYLLVAMKDTVAVYEPPFKLLGNLKLVGHEDIEIQGLSIYQGSTSKYPKGALAYAIEAEGIKAFGVSSLEAAIQTLVLKANTTYDPSKPIACSKQSPICSSCSNNGFCTKNGKAIECSCFAGFQGKSCDKYTCEDNCSGHGKCEGPNQCKCDKGWGGLHCSFVLVEPVAETDANGGDGDDPAIWISPTDRGQSCIITTTKSEQGAGLGVFDLSGKLLQTMPAGEPNNVDVIYNFEAGSRKIDLAYAACRADDTLCMFEIHPNGTLAAIPGGIQPLTLPSGTKKFKVYGSCAYRSPTTHKQYLFVNAKTSQYLQYELSSFPNGTLTTTLVRSFFAGSGGQVEGCVTDEQNGWIFIGEEPHALWRYDAEPSDQNPKRVAVATVGDGHLRADVEGVTMVFGKTKDDGFILVSNQGVSAYNVYQRKAPHEFVLTFTITEGEKVDAVSNTDGIAAVGTGLGDKFPRGVIVVHDDANELPGRKGTSEAASFKLVPLDKVLGAEGVKQLGLLEQVDKDWDPRG